jgi:hypothetical protein
LTSEVGDSGRVVAAAALISDRGGKDVVAISARAKMAAARMVATVFIV